MMRHLLTGLSICLALLPAHGKDQPNVLFILADDMGWQDTSVPFAEHRTKWNDRYRTPALECLASEGSKFTQAYSCAVCSPTRVERPFVWHFPNFWGGLELPEFRKGPGLGPSSTLRRGDWKLIYCHTDRSFELFDLGNDLGETQNLAGKETGRLRALATELSDVLRGHNSPMPIVQATGQPVPLPIDALP